MGKRAYHHGDLARAIREAARAVVAEGGVGAVNLRAIARQLGVSEAAAYHHFRGRDDVIARLAEEGYAALRVQLEEATRDVADPWERLAALGRATLRFSRVDRGRHRAMFGAHMERLAVADEALFREGRATWELIEDGARDVAAAGGPDADTVARIAWAMVHGLSSLLVEREIRLEGGDLAAEALGERAIDVLIAGLRAQSAGRGKPAWENG